MGLRVYLELRVRLRVGLEDDGGVVPAEAEIVRDRLGRVRDRGRGSVRGRGRGGGKGRVTTTLSLTSATASASA